MLCIKLFKVGSIIFTDIEKTKSFLESIYIYINLDDDDDDIIVIIIIIIIIII